MTMSTNDICTMITERVIAELEKGRIPWEKPWIAPEGLCGAFNRISKKPYSILNQILLGEPGEYASMKQWNDLGGKVRKGEKGNIVVFWKPYHKDVTATDNETGEEITKSVPFFILRYYYVFHIDQVEGVEPLKAEEDDPANENKPLEKAEHILKNYTTHEGIKFVRSKTNQAFYKPSQDKIVVPNIKYFNSSEAFYDTTFHEMTHSTGHSTRLNRLDKKASFGNEEYSKEELVAEIGSAALANYAGTSTEKTERNNTAYIQSWLKPLKEDVRFIVSAAGKAEKAVEYILNAVKAQDEAVTE